MQTFFMLFNNSFFHSRCYGAAADAVFLSSSVLCRGPERKAKNVPGKTFSFIAVVELKNQNTHL